MKLKLNWEKGGGGAECLCRGLNEERLSENDSIKIHPHILTSKRAASLRFLSIPCAITTASSPFTWVVRGTELGEGEEVERSACVGD